MYLDNMIEIINGLWIGKKPPYTKIKVIRNTNFTKDCQLNLVDVAEIDVETKQFEKRELKYGDIILEKSGGGPKQPVGRVVFFNLIEGQYSFSNFTSTIRVKDNNKIVPKYLYLCLKHLYQIGYTNNLQKQTTGLRNLNLNEYKKIKFPLPPLEIQEQVVEELDGYQKIIDGATQIIENWKPNFKIDPKWEKVKLESVSNISSGTTPSTNNNEYYKGNNPFIKTNQIVNNIIESADIFVSDKAVHDFRLKIYPKNTVLLAMYGQGKTRGQVALLGIDGSITQNAAAIVTKSTLNPIFLWVYLISQYENLRKTSINTLISHLNLNYVKNIEIPLPSIEEQHNIVNEIEKEKAVIAPLKELIDIYKEKINKKIEEVWGD
jgi:restriction endonuclease S subunit